MARLVHKWLPKQYLIVYHYLTASHTRPPDKIAFCDFPTKTYLVANFMDVLNDIIQLMHSFEVNIRICQPENSDVHRGEAEVNITFEG